MRKFLNNDDLFANIINASVTDLKLEGFCPTQEDKDLAFKALKNDRFDNIIADIVKYSVQPSKRFTPYDEYLYPGTNVLINKLNITCAEPLAPTECTIALIRIAGLRSKFITGDFDVNHIKSIYYDMIKENISEFWVSPLDL